MWFLYSVDCPNLSNYPRVEYPRRISENKNETIVFLKLSDFKLIVIGFWIIRRVQSI